VKSTSYCILLSLYLIYSGVSCTKSPCNDCGDPDGRYSISAKIVNQQGQNLIFGPSALYNSDSIRLLKQKNPPVSIGVVYTNIRNSTLGFEFNTIEAKNYIYYNSQTPMDSLELIWSTKTFKCCGHISTYNIIDSVKFNQTFVKPVNENYTLIK
jgi:hypothetical protein